MSNAPRPARPEIRSRSWAGQVRALGQRMSLSPSFSGASGGAARRAYRRHLELALGAVAELDDRPDDLGDHVAGLAQHHGVADEHALAAHLVGVVQRGPLDRGTRDDDRGHHAERRHPSGAADVDLDVEELGVDLLGRVLVGDRPPRRPRRRPELALDDDLVDLDDHPVQLVLDAVPLLPEPRDVGLDVRDRVEHLVVRRDRQAPLAEEVVRLRLPGQLESLAVADAVNQHVQRPRRGDARVLLSQRPGGAVARVGERCPPCRDERGVELLETLHGEEHLAADLDLGRVTGPAQPVRDALDGLDVVGDVLARTPVTAGQGPGQPAVLVEQVDGEAVDLQLAEVVVRAGVGVTGGPRGPGGQLLGREAVVEAEHPLEVVDRLELGRERRPADQLGRALRGAQRRVLLLQLVEPPDHPVVVGIADRRRVAHVVVELRGQRVLRDLGPLVQRLGRYARGLGRRGDLGSLPLAGAGSRRSRRHRSILPYAADNTAGQPPAWRKRVRCPATFPTTPHVGIW